MPDDAIVLPIHFYCSGCKEDVKLIVNMEDFLPYGVTFYGDTGTVTITATIAKLKSRQQKMCRKKKLQTEDSR